MKKIGITLFAAILALAVSAAAQDNAGQAPVPKPKTAAPKAGAASAAKPATATARSPYDRALLKPQLLKAKAPDTFQVKFVTTKGDFTVTVTRAWAPLGADRFYNLAKHHFFDGSSFFRVVPNFVVQFGLSAYPAVSKAWTDAKIGDDPVTQTNQRGYVTFATGGPGTRTTQLFINLGDNSRLDHEPSGPFAPFAQVTEGMTVVDQLYSGYGDGPPRGRGPEQDLIEKQGKTYIDSGFPNLDTIKSATLVGLPAAAAPVTKPGAKPAAKPATRATPQKQ